MQPARAILENDFKHGFLAVAVSLQAQRDDFAARGTRLIDLHLRDGAEMSPVFIAARAVEQQVFNRVESQPRQLRRALGTDAAQVLQGPAQWREWRRNIG